MPTFLDTLNLKNIQNVVNIQNVANNNISTDNIATSSKIGDFVLYEKKLKSDELPEDYNGTTSMFNEYNVFYLNDYAQTIDIDGHVYDPTYTSPMDVFSYNEAHNRPEGEGANNGGFSYYHMYKAPRASALIRDFAINAEPSGAAPYAWSDFLYCKYYGKIPNNQLITLRRYSSPVSDDLTITMTDESGGIRNVAHPPIAQAVTWLGKETNNKLSEILKFSFGLKWKEIEAKVQDIMGNEVGFGAGLEGIFGAKKLSSLGKVANLFEDDKSIMSGYAEKMQNWRKKAWSDEGPYWNQIYGPVNVVNKTNIRDRGMKFTNDITLNFHYSLSSINGVNPKTALIDIITNFLTLTYNNAKFWGGSIRYFPNFSSSILFKGDINAFYNGEPKKYIDSIYEALASTIKEGSNFLVEAFHLNGSFSDVLSNLKSGSYKTAKVVLKSFLDTMYAKYTKHSRPEFLSIRNLLSGEPVGEWHLTIGNPYNPIAVIGNLLVDNVDMSFDETLGADDFPTGVTFTVKLKHARPRDKGDIESIFNNGKGRITYSPLSQLSSERNTMGENWKRDMNTQDISHAMSGSVHGQSLLSSDAQKMLRSDDSLERNSIKLDENGTNFIKQRIEYEWGYKFNNSLLNSMLNNKKINS